MKAAVAFALLLVGVGAANPCYSQSFALHRSVLGGGGIGASGGSYRLTATAAQPAVGLAANVSTLLCSGFWCLAGLPVVVVPDLPPAHRDTGSALGANVPNPFNPSTTLFFHIERAGLVVLEVFDAAGRKVRTLVGGSLAAGDHRVTWTGTDDAGRPVASGVYFAHLLTDDSRHARQMVMVK